MYMTDSRFNTETMTNYIANGKTIMPPTVPGLLGNLSANDTISGISFDLSNSSSGNSSTPMLDMLSTS